MSLDLLKAVSAIIGNCVGSGSFMCATMLYPFGVNAFYGWLITGIGALCMGMLFLIMSEKSKEATMHGIIASNFSTYKTLVKNLVFYLYIFFAAFSNAALAMLIHQGYKSLNPFVCYFLSFLLVYIINRCQLETASHINTAMSVLKAAVLIVLPIIAIHELDPVQPTFTNNFNIEMAISASFRALWPFVGIESIAVDSGIKIKYLKRSLFLGVGICLLIYVLNTYAIFYYVQDAARFSIADQQLVEKVAPSFIRYFNIFIMFLGFNCLNSWTKTIIVLCTNSDAPTLLKNRANEIVCVFGLLATILIKFYIPEYSFDFIFDFSTVLLLAIYFLAALSFYIGYRLNIGLSDKIIFLGSLGYIFIASSGICISLLV